ncbi:MAG: DNA repair exonuclease [Ruminococcaceae bacterium]|nr:DNA repair exonuclease [Oscillospiraceae bacterium]
MKILHMADCHLDSVMERHLPARVAKARRRELLLTFSAAVSAAEKEGASLVLIAGDLFDTPTPSEGALRYVLDCISAHADMTFLYIEGNHDAGALSNSAPPPNMLLVPARKSAVFSFDDVKIYAAGFGVTEETIAAFECKENEKNILLLHGTLTTSRADIREEMILRTALDNKKVDYLALGHFHTHTAMRLSRGGLACYAGTPEGRGFDETGRCGVILLDTDTMKADFLTTAQRTLHNIEVDVTGAVTLPEIEKRVNAAVAAIPESDMVRLHLIGEVEEHYLKQPEQIKLLLDGRFFFARVKDGIRLRMRPTVGDVSLRGEFIRRVLSDSSLSEEDKQRVLSYGLRALDGELPEDTSY